MLSSVSTFSLIWRDCSSDVNWASCEMNSKFSTGFRGSWYRNQSVRATTQYVYNGLNAVVQETKLGAGDADRVSTFTYDAGLLKTQNIAGVVTTYDYDATGNITRVSIDRSDADGAVRNEAELIKYDAMNREVLRASTWKTPSQTTWITTLVKEVRYNKYGEITGRRSAATAGVAATPWQEYADYDSAGSLSLVAGSDNKAYTGNGWRVDRTGLYVRLADAVDFFDLRKSLDSATAEHAYRVKVTYKNTNGSTVSQNLYASSVLGKVTWNLSGVNLAQPIDIGLFSTTDQSLGELTGAITGQQPVLQHHGAADAQAAA
ncbi:hypothetical protein N5K27_27125 [Pigmentiphaga sp. GD03639]|uniref:hypothetical protein n=1 Tax=Pigmentiphaga sp. GD03639 TaxID=2975354 RepID=UPI002449D2CF|nr:hypothetical protein [Pigmentiphaga sp. GD03639]MDH2239974.1 hypothetical protein [Pigmentiphaga sp. GD03639]